MTLAVLDRLARAHEGLIAALDGNDLAGIESATARLTEAVDEARALDPESLRPELKDRLSSLAVLAHAAQGRVNFLTDSLRRRVDMLSAIAGRPPAMTYRPYVR